MKYVSKRVGMMILTLFIVSFLVFISFSLIPGDPAVSKLGMNATPEAVETLREEMGLNQPLLTRYGQWVVSFVKGDMGTSYSYGMPVSELVMSKLPITLCLSGMAFLLMIICAIPLGIYTAKHEGGVMDHVIMVLNQVTMAIPPFFLGILITYLFGLVLHLFVPGGYISYDVNLGGFISYMIFPAIAIALPKIAMTVNLLRGAIIDQKKAEYVRTAYSKGNNSNRVFYSHMLKNALIPTITFMGMVLADMIASSIIVEQVFGIPGLGRILLTSISNRDYPVVEAIIVCIAFFVIVINFVVDILYRVIDPRIRLTDQ